VRSRVADAATDGAGEDASERVRRRHRVRLRVGAYARLPTPSMSTLSFPHDDDAQGIYGASSGFAPSGAGAGGFQMNPFSAHPPRTPRASTVGHGDSSVYGTTLYGAAEDVNASGPPAAPLQEGYSTDDPDPESERAKQRAARIRRAEVWHELFTTSVGRDKALVSERPCSPT
jgi:hypothetical protein